MEDQIEHDVVACFISSGCDLNDKEVAEEISNCVHDELFSSYSRDKAKSMGVPVQNKIHNFRPFKSELTIEDRKSAIAKAKANSTCRACGQVGHWAGNPE